MCNSLYKHHSSRASIMHVCIHLATDQHSKPYVKIGSTPLLYSFNFIEGEIHNFQKCLSRLCMVAYVRALCHRMSGRLLWRDDCTKVPRQTLLSSSHLAHEDSASWLPPKVCIYIVCQVNLSHRDSTSTGIRSYRHVSSAKSGSVRSSVQTSCCSYPYWYVQYAKAQG